MRTVSIIVAIAGLVTALVGAYLYFTSNVKPAYDRVQAAAKAREAKALKNIENGTIEERQPADTE